MGKWGEGLTSDSEEEPEPDAPVAAAAGACFLINASRAAG
jgi:hypothetical protein